MEKKMTNRQLAALETKRRLLEAAKKIVCEKGLVNTSIEEITRQAAFLTVLFTPISSAKRMSSLL